MLMEGREPQQTRAIARKKTSSLKLSPFTTKVAALTSRAKQIHSAPLQNLAHLIDKTWLRESWRRLRKGASYGIDAVSAKDYAENLEANLEALLQKLKQGSYKAPPVRRVYIPKADGKRRPLGLPTIEDKTVQNAVAIIFTAIYEQEFLPMSYGFRPERNAHQALETVKATIAQKKVSWVLDADIKSFFDMMDHEWLMKFIMHRVSDKRLLKLVRKWLKAGIMEDGKLIKSSSGAPQGGVISPVLANIYLHYVVDLWFTKVAMKHLEGEAYAYRYADDSVPRAQRRLHEAINVN